MRTILFLVGCLCLVAGHVNAQDLLHKQSPLPPSPETAAFAKNISIPMSYVSGTPQISIPFGSVKSGSIQVPVSISYNASGIRVEETPTWVGLGWSLSAGGQITRTVRGLPDEVGCETVGPMRTIKFVDSAHCRCTELNALGWEIEQELNTYGSLDVEPDQYNFSFGGYSGEFHYNQDSGKFILRPYQNLLLERAGGGWRFITPDGTRYFFGGYSAAEESLQSGTTASYIDGVSYDAVPIGNTPYTNSWMLTEIIDATGKTVKLDYVAEWNIVFGRGGESFGKSLIPPNDDIGRQSFYRQVIRKPVLSKISGESGNIYFKRSSVHREDMPDPSGGYDTYSLDTILITNVSNETLRSFYFTYGYFTSAPYGAGGMLNISSFGEVARKRLYLKSIQEKNGSASVPPYEFVYDETELPSRLSNSQDYWGYYNGKSNIWGKLMPRVTSAVPFTFIPNYLEVNKILPSYGGYMNYDGADRRIDTNYTQARVLRKIKYPTGGSTEYFYESNDASTFYQFLYGGMEPPDLVDKSYTFSMLSNPVPADPPYPVYFTGTFDVTYPATKVKVTPTLPTCTTYNDAMCKMLVRIKRLPDSLLMFETATTNVTQIQLHTGHYLVEAFINGSTDDYPLNFNVAMQWGERPDSFSFKVGGLRVKKIVSTDSVGRTISRSFRYRLNGTTESSGALDGMPTYNIHETKPNGEIVSEHWVSNSVLPLTTDGRTVRYKFVSEFYDQEATSYKTDYTFTSFEGSPTIFSRPQTGAPLNKRDWQNGLLALKQDYEKTGETTYRILAEEKQYYYPHGPTSYLLGLYGPQIIPYIMDNEWYLPDSTVNISYAYPGGSQTALQTTSKTIYNNRYLPAIVRTTNSKGEVIQARTTYPSDYNNVSGYNIATLLGKHIIGVPIKQETSVNNKIRSGSIIKYNEWAQPIEGYSYENAALSDVVTHDKNTVLESNYQLKTTLRYDAQGNLKQMNNYKSGPVAYIWDFQINGFTGAHMNEVPVAAVQNADSTDVAYCSFEAAGQGNWFFVGTAYTDATAPMGNKCHLLTGQSLSRTGLSSGKTYIVSYWSKNGPYTLTGNPTPKQGKTLNGWTLYEYEFTGTTSMEISGTGYIDEVRLYPKGGMMTSYAYRFGYGITSQADAANRITYYEYDDLQRLSFVRNEDKQILKRICYNYAGQAINCGVDTSAIWTAINSECQQSGGVNTGYLVVKEKNMNPASVTYNQTRTTIIASNGACAVCDTSNCSGNDKKCINNVCETGVKVITGSVRLTSTTWRCYYHYVWSDASTSPTYDEVTEGLGSCVIL